MRTADAEVELLVRCADAAGVEDEARIRSLVAASPDWERVLELARTHGVTPLVNRTVRAVSRPDASTGASDGVPEEVPEEVLARLADRTRSIAMRNLRSAGELHAILDAFEDRGIRALPFKGPVLARFAYGDVGLREFGDLDLLVHREDVREAVDVLEARGYEWRDAPRRDDAALLGGPFTMSLVPEYGLRRRDLEVEVRWRVGDPDRPFGLDVETLWTRRETVAVAGEDVPALSPEDRLLVLAFHGTKHRWHLLKWICDFAASMEATDVAWPGLLRRAGRCGTERKLLVGVALADSLFGVDVPDGVERRLSDDARVATLADRVVDDLLAGSVARPDWTERAVYNARASDSAADVLRMLLRLSPLHPSLPEYRLLPLPGPLHPIYYPLRPLRLIAERSRSVLGDPT